MTLGRANMFAWWNLNLIRQPQLRRSIEMVHFCLSEWSFQSSHCCLSSVGKQSWTIIIVVPNLLHVLAQRIPKLRFLAKMQGWLAMAFQYTRPWGVFSAWGFTTRWLIWTLKSPSNISIIKLMRDKSLTVVGIATYNRPQCQPHRVVCAELFGSRTPNQGEHVIQRCLSMLDATSSALPWHPCRPRFVLPQPL